MSKIIIFEALPYKHYAHFIHYMQYLYWCTDIILSWNDSHYKYIIVEPKNKSNGRYVEAFLQNITEKVNNIELISMSRYSHLNLSKSIWLSILN